MRQKLDLVNAPNTVPAACVVSSEASKLPAHGMSVENALVVKSLFQQIDPGLLDLASSCLTPRAAAKFTTMKEPDQRKFSISTSIVLAERESGWCILMHAPGQSVDGRLLCAGTSGQLFEFVARYSPDNFPYMVRQARRGVISHPKGDGWDTLTKYRLDRSYCRGLERITKMEELYELEQDFTMNKFLRFLKGPRIVHYGAGGLFSPSLFGMANFETVGVDPNGRAGPYFSTDTWQEYDDEAFGPDQIVSDVAIGDEYGLTEHGLQDFIDAHVPFQGDVVVKTAPFVDVWGELLAKPRPHNLEIIVRMGDSELDCDKIRQDIWKANRARNEKVFTATTSTSFKFLYNTDLEIRRLFDHDYRRFIVLSQKRISKFELDRNSFLADVTKKKRMRFERMLQLSTDKTLCPVGQSYCLLPFTAAIGQGPIHLFEPGIGAPEFSFFSVWMTALERGFDVQFSDGHWTARRMRDHLKAA